MRVLIFSFFLLPLFGSEDLDYITSCPSRSSVASKKPPPVEKPPVIQYGNPPSFCGAKEVRAFLYGEPFLASVREDGISFAIRSTGNPLQGKLVEPAARWRPGFRVGGGVHFDHDAWEGAVDWTYFRNNQIRSMESGAITPLFIDASSYAQIPQGFFHQAKEQWLLTFNRIRVTLARPYFLSKQLAISPTIGFFSAWIDQSLELSYRSNSQSNQGVVASVTDIQNNAWRIGPLLATKLNWYIHERFWLEGSLQGAALYKRCNSHQRQNSVGNLNGDFRILFDENAIAVQPWVDASLGFGWGSCFNCLKNYFEISFLYEVQYFWNELYSRTLDQQVQGSQNRFLNNLGDLSMQSASVRVRLDF